MDWTQMVIVVVGIIAVATLVVHYIPAKKHPDLEQTAELNAKIIVLEGAVAQRDEAIKNWTDLHGRSMNRDTASSAIVMKIFDSIANIVKNPAEVEALKTIIENIKRKDTK